MCCMCVAVSEEFLAPERKRILEALLEVSAIPSRVSEDVLGIVAEYAVVL